MAKQRKKSNLTKNLSNLIIKQVNFDKRNGVEMSVTVLQCVQEMKQINICFHFLFTSNIDFDGKRILNT